MASKGKIDSIIDQQKVDAEIKTLMSQIDGLISKLESVPKAALNIAGDFKSAKNINDVSEAQKKLTTTNEELQKILAKNAVLEAKIDSLRNGEARKLAETTEALKKRNAEIALNAKINAAAEGSLARMRLELIKMRKEYDNLGDTSTETAKKQLKNIDDLDRKVKEAEKSQGIFNRNVGNYPNILTGSDGIFKKYGLNLKDIGSKLLGVGAALGIVGTATGAFKAIIASVDSISDSFEANLSGLAEAGKFFARAIATMDFTNMVSGFRDAYMEGKRYAGVLDELGDRQIALGLQKKDIELEIINLKIIARDRRNDLQTRTDAVDQIVKLEEKKLTSQKDYNKIALDNDLQTAMFRSKLTAGEITDLVKNYDKYLVFLQKATKQEAEIRADATESRTDIDTGLIVETFDQVAYNKMIAQLDGGERYFIRLAAGYNKIDADFRKKLNETIGGMTDANISHAEGIASLSKLRNSLYNELIADERETFRLTEKNAKDEVDLKKKTLEEEQKAVQEAITTINDMYEQSGNQRTKDLTLQMNSEMDTLITAYKNGEIELEDYEANKLEIENRYAKLALQNAIEIAEQKIAVLKLSGFDTVKSEEDLFTLKQNLRNLETKDFEDQAKVQTDITKKSAEEQLKIDEEKAEKQNEIEKRKQDALKELQKQFIDTVNSLVNSYYDNQLQKIDQQKEQDAEAKEKELQLAGDNKEKQDQINAKYEAREKARDRERRRIEIEKARFQKMSSAFNVILSTSEAIMKAVAEFPLTGGMPFSGIAAAIGALQLAAIMAQPLPKYFKGRKGGDAEFAWVGEQGQEAIRLQDGTTFLTPGKPTLTFLPENSDVITNSELMRVVRNTSFSGSPVNYEQLGLTNLQGEIKNLKSDFDRVVNAIKFKKEYHINITERGLQKVAKDGANMTRYINQNIKL